jgi:transcriptional regulator GlxA family with amidase domain
MNPFNSTFGESIVPTHTFENAPPLDVLFIPGGVGTLATDLNSTVAFVAETYPSLQYLVSVCTGARIAARAGILDGRNATTNKLAWNTVVNLGPKTSWRAHARWIVDGNVWTGAGVSAGIDTALAWMGAVRGEDVANSIALGMEYERHSNATWDPFSTYYNLTDVINGIQVQSSS